MQIAKKVPPWAAVVLVSKNRFYFFRRKIGLTTLVRYGVQMLAFRTKKIHQQNNQNHQSQLKNLCESK